MAGHLRFRVIMSHNPGCCGECNWPGGCARRLATLAVYGKRSCSHSHISIMCCRQWSISTRLYRSENTIQSRSICHECVERGDERDGVNGVFHGVGCTVIFPVIRNTRLLSHRTYRTSE